MQKSIVINNLTELQAAANELLNSCKEKRVFAFFGEMGAGKTTFIKSICEALGVKDPISSPTFSIVNEYLSVDGKKIYHFDFYRIKNVNEAYDMGYEDYLFSNAYCFIEWPEKIAELLPENSVNVNITVKGEQRVISFENVEH